jgi:hypothetical protein
MNPLAQRLRTTIRRDPIAWARACGITLRPYQREVARAIKDSIVNDRGLTFVVIFPRQSGKNVVQAHIFAWSLYRFGHTGGHIVSVSPTFKQQTTNNMDKVRQSLDACVGTRGRWKSSGSIFRFHRSVLTFFSAHSSANVVGATADLFLSVDEAQDVDIAKFDRDFDPMTASTNATRVFWGTAWTSNTLLARQMRIAKQEQEADGIQRLFIQTADDIRKIVPDYGTKVDQVIRQQGRQNPMVKTQYFCEEIDAQAGMFNAGRCALMQGDQPAQSEPIPGHVYAFLIDVAGMDEALLNLDGMGNPGRDSTTLSIVDIDLSALETLQAPIYRLVNRQSWQGENHLSVFGKLKAFADVWQPQHIVIDATGVGEGLWAMLDRAFPTRVLPVKFTRQSKSEIGWGFIAIIESGRFRDCSARVSNPAASASDSPSPNRSLIWGGARGGVRRGGFSGERTSQPSERQANIGYIGNMNCRCSEHRLCQRQESLTQSPSPISVTRVTQPSEPPANIGYIGDVSNRCDADSPSLPGKGSGVRSKVLLQYSHCESDVLPGPAHTLRWGVKDGTRGPDGQLVHDDFILADSLTAELDKLEWHLQFGTTILEFPDPDIEMQRNF